MNGGKKSGARARFWLGPSTYGMFDTDFPGPWVILNRLIGVPYAGGAEAGVLALDASTGQRRGAELSGYENVHSTRAERDHLKDREVQVGSR